MFVILFLVVLFVIYVVTARGYMRGVPSYYVEKVLRTIRKSDRF